MARIIYCQKLKCEAAGLEFMPYPGAVGERIYNNISQKAWGMWLNQQTMLINELRLQLTDPTARALLQEKMIAFLFSDEDVAPSGFKA